MKSRLHKWGIHTLVHALENWQHLFKLDPAKQITDTEIKRLCTSGTDAIIVGGTDQVTWDNVHDLIMRLSEFDIPCLLEISTPEAIVMGFDHYLIPMVMNSREKKWVMDIQHEAIKQYHAFMDWDDIFMEGYCILNESSQVYQKTNCKLPSEADVLAYAHMAEHVFKLPIFYVEYSGTYGDPKLLEHVSQELNKTLLVYGGGISNRKQAEEMSQYANMIIIGDCIYTDFEQALQTVLK